MSFLDLRNSCRSAALGQCLAGVEANEIVMDRKDKVMKWGRLQVKVVGTG